MAENFATHAIGLYVANKPGVLNRIALVFSRRGYNLDSLVVSPARDTNFSHMNIIASGERETLDQILKQLNKLVDVVHARDRHKICRHLHDQISGHFLWFKHAHYTATGRDEIALPFQQMSILRFLLF